MDRVNGRRVTSLFRTDYHRRFLKGTNTALSHEKQLLTWPAGCSDWLDGGRRMGRSEQSPESMVPPRKHALVDPGEQPTGPTPPGHQHDLIPHHTPRFRCMHTTPMPPLAQREEPGDLVE